jgi:prevent-host-death family protein
MTIVIGAREARQRFADLLGRVGYGGEVAIVERSGKPMVALIPVEVYEQFSNIGSHPQQSARDLRKRG